MVSKWFKGKELALALACNLTIARLGNVIIGLIVTPLNDAVGLGGTFSVGAGICVFSVITVVFLCFVDRYADKYDGKDQNGVSDEDKFKFSYLLTFRTKFWLICAGCVLTYSAVFPFMSLVTKMLETKYCIPDNVATKLYVIPYVISAATSPPLGFMVDRVGKRVLLVIGSSVLILLGHIISIMLPGYSPPANPSCTPLYGEIGVLVIIGLGFSLYAAALWPAVPYVVSAKTVGTAFGVCTALQNAGLGLVPYLSGLINKRTEAKDFGYFWESVFWAGLITISLILDILLYIIDMRTGGVLNKVDKGIQDLITSPKPEERRTIAENEEIDDNLKDYMLSKNARNALKRSMA